MIHLISMMHVLAATESGDGGSLVGLLFGCIGFVIEIGLLVLIIAGMWKLFVKAGEPGWAAIIPIYNWIILLKICNKPIWWFILFLIPCVGLIFFIIIALELAKAFGKSPVYGIGIILLPFIFMPMLGFSNAQYVGTKATF